MEMLNCVTLGGGGGQGNLLAGLRGSAESNLAITAICAPSDSGGSTGILREEYPGIPGYLGDAGRCMLALSEPTDLHRALDFRFPDGSLATHSVRNLMFAGFIRKHGEPRALDLMHQIFSLPERYRVYPACYGSVHLEVLVEKRWITGEAYIDKIRTNQLWNPKHHQIRKIRLKPPGAKANPQAVAAIQKAQMIIIPPGDLYTSVLPVLLAKGFKEAIIESKAKLVMVANLMTKEGETDGYGLGDFIDKIQLFSGRLPDAILANNGKIPKALLQNYRKKEGKSALVIGTGGGNTRCRYNIALADLWRDNAGRLEHDPEKTAAAIRRLGWLSMG